jgi:hypothetical protein
MRGESGQHRAGRMLLLEFSSSQDENGYKNNKRDKHHNNSAESIAIPVRMPSEQEQQADDDKKDKDDNDKHYHIVDLSSLGISVPILLFILEIAWKAFLSYYQIPSGTANKKTRRQRLYAIVWYNKRNLTL